MEEICGRSFPRQSVSEACAEPDPAVAAFRDRPLEGERPFVMADATYLRVRVDHRVQGCALMVAVGLASQGRKEVGGGGRVPQRGLGRQADGGVPHGGERPLGGAEEGVLRHGLRRLPGQAGRARQHCAQSGQAGEGGVATRESAAANLHTDSDLTHAAVRRRHACGFARNEACTPGNGRVGRLMLVNI